MDADDDNQVPDSDTAKPEMEQHEADANKTKIPIPNQEQLPSVSYDEEVKKDDAKQQDDGMTHVPLSTVLGATSLSHHDASPTMGQVVQLYQKGEQPKTDKKEIWAWYCYDFANSPFSGVVMSLLLPLLLTDLAEEYGCGKTTYGCDLHAQDLESGQVIQVYVGAWELKATSYAAGMVGLASLVQALIYLFVGPIADYGSYRTLLFRITAIGSGILTCLYIFWGDKALWQFVGWWTVIVSVLYGLSIIFYNSWLPIIVETHPDVIDACKEQISDHKLKRIIEHKTDELALVGFRWGYIGGIIVLVICLAILLFEPPSYIEGDEYGSEQKAFISDTHSSFAELWARDINAGDIYYTVDNDDEHFVYINGLQFIYNGLNGGMHGVVSNNTQHFEFDGSVDEVQIYTSDAYDHICGLSFHDISSNTYTNIGNTTVITDVVQMNSISEEDMVFGGISGSYGALIDNNEYAISSLSVLLVHTSGEFRGGLSTLHERIGILFNGIWLLVFSFVSIKYLKHRPGPDLPKEEHIALFGVKQTIKTIRKARQFPTLFTYLIAYFLFSDGIGTLLSCGVLFGRELLHMSNTQLAFMILEVYVVGTIGTYLFLKIEEKYAVPSKYMLCMHLVFLSFLPIWGLIGLIPGSSFGLKHLIEIYLWSFAMGIHIGSIQCFARSVFAQIIPVGHESEMFALFEITDKGSSWLGPLVIAIVSDATDMRWAVFYIMLFFLIPLPIIWRLDMDKGRFEAGRSPQQVTKRASLLFDIDDIDELKKDLADIVSNDKAKELESIKEDKKDKHEPTTEEALEMVLEKNLTITEEVFTDEED